MSSSTQWFQRELRPLVGAVRTSGWGRAAFSFHFAAIGPGNGGGLGGVFLGFFLHFFLLALLLALGFNFLGHFLKQLFQVAVIALEHQGGAGFDELAVDVLVGVLAEGAQERRKISGGSNSTQ